MVGKFELGIGDFCSGLRERAGLLSILFDELVQDARACEAQDHSCMYDCIHVCMYVCLCVYVCMCVYTYLYIYVCIMNTNTIRQQGPRKSR